MSNTRYADEGSVAHALASMCLDEGTDAVAYLGRLIECSDYEHAQLSASGSKKWMACPGSHALERDARGDFEERFFEREVTLEMALYVQSYLDAVRARQEEYQQLGAREVITLVEQRLPLEQVTGEPGATGTGDIIIIAVWDDGSATLDIGDLKTGAGVRVDAENNSQLLLYASGALEEYGLIYWIHTIRLSIYQPRISTTPSEWKISVDELRAFEASARRAAIAAKREHAELVPGDHCRTGFCSARATCPALAAVVAAAVDSNFADLDANATANDTLADKMASVDLVEDWCKAVRAETERRLFAGTEVPGWKLVAGKRGARKWSSDAEAEMALKAMRLKQDEIYDFKVISPTTAEKRLRDQPKRWAKLQPLISQSDGKPSVAPASDPRPALAPASPTFDPVTDLSLVH